MAEARQTITKSELETVAMVEMRQTILKQELQAELKETLEGPDSGNGESRTGGEQEVQVLLPILCRLARVASCDLPMTFSKLICAIEGLDAWENVRPCAGP